jgi:alkylated DNA repair dioxygenase AlkB
MAPSSSFITNLLPSEGEVIFYPQFFSTQESDHYFAVLEQSIEWKQEPIKIFGRTLMQPRLTALYGEPDKAYSYSGIRMHPLEWTNALLKIKEKIETKSGVVFTTALLNYYRDGKDSMGWHRDNEKSLGINPVIGSLSFGSTRTFQFRKYSDKNVIRSVELTHGSFLLMKGATQHFWEHQLPKTNKQTKARINITFRVIY